MTRKIRRQIRLLLAFAVLTALPAAAGYKLLHWSPRAIDSYPARQTNDGVTIAVEPLYTNELAAKVFDRKDMLDHRILPLAVVVRNDNDFAVEIDADSVELMLEGSRLRTLDPRQTLQRLYGLSATGRVPERRPLPIPRPLPRVTAQVPKEASQDFEQKFFAHKRIFSHSTDGGFLYIPLPPFPAPTDVRARLAKASVYLPEVRRVGTGAELMFFELELTLALDAAAKKQ